MMHCSDEALIKNDSEQTRAHLSQCQDCQQRLWQLKQLKSDADKLPLYQPSELAWDKIKQSLPSQEKSPAEDNVVSLRQPQQSDQPKSPRRFRMPLMVAASFAMGGMMTLMANQLWQDNRLAEQIAISGEYEKQLVALQLTSPMVESQLWQISQVDAQLNQAKSVKQRRQLWQKRNELLKQLLEQSHNVNQMI